MNQIPLQYFNIFFRIKGEKQIYIPVSIYMINGCELSIYMMNNITIIE